MRYNLFLFLCKLVVAIRRRQYIMKLRLKPLQIRNEYKDVTNGLQKCRPMIY